MHELEVIQHEDGVGLRVRAKPRASRSQILGCESGVLVVALAAPPVDGEANQELARVLGRALGLAPTRVKIRSGSTGKQKTLRIEGLSAADLLERLLASAPGERA